MAFGSYFNLAVGFLATLLLTRLLDPSSFGAYALGLFFFSILNLRPKVGIAAAFEQRRELSGELVGTHLVLDIAVGLASLALAAAAGPILVALGYSADVTYILLALAGVGMLDAFSTTASSLLARELHFRELTLVSTIIFPLSYLPALWLAFSGAGYWSLVAQSATNSFLHLFGLWWAAMRQVPAIRRGRWSFSRRTARELVRFGLPLGVSGYASVLTLQFDDFLVGTFAGEAILGFYDRAYRIAQWPTQLVSSVISRVAFQAYARLQDDPDRLRTTLQMSVWLTTSSALPLAIAIFVAAPDLVLVLFGERWLPSVPFVRLLVVSSVLRPLLDNVTALLTGAGRPGITSLVVAVQAATLVVAGLALTLGYGPAGTAIAVGLSFVVGLVLAFRFVGQVTRLRLPAELVVPLVAALAVLVLHLVLVRVVDFDAWAPWLRALAKLGYAGLGFYLLILLLRPGTTLARGRYVARLVLRR